MNDRSDHLDVKNVVLLLLKPVVSELGAPSEVISALNLLINEVFDDLSAVHIQYNERLKSSTELSTQLATHKLYNIKDLPVDLVTVGFHLALTHVSKHVLDSSGPIDLIDGEDNLTRPSLNPVSTLALIVVIDGLEGPHLKCRAHDLFDLEHPLFDVTFLVALIDIDLLVKIDDLLLS